MSQTQEKTAQELFKKTSGKVIEINSMTPEQQKEYIREYYVQESQQEQPTLQDSTKSGQSPVLKYYSTQQTKPVEPVPVTQPQPQQQPQPTIEDIERQAVESHVPETSIRSKPVKPVNITKTYFVGGYGEQTVRQDPRTRTTVGTRILTKEMEVIAGSPPIYKKMKVLRPSLVRTSTGLKPSDKSAVKPLIPKQNVPETLIVGPSAKTQSVMVEKMGKAPESITGVLREARDKFFDNPIAKANKRMYEVQKKADPIKATLLTGSPLHTTQSAKGAIDIGIGFVKGGESLVNPNVKTATGALVGSGIQAITGKGTGTYVEDYLKSIKDREGEFIGEAIFDIALGKALGKVVSKVSKVRVGSKTDELLLKHSSRYRKGAEATLKSRPQVVSSPVFDVGQKTYTWSQARQKAIDLAFQFELTSGSSGVTAPALLESGTKSVVLPHLFSRGGQVTIGYLRSTGFTRQEQGLLSAPQQIFVQTQTQSKRVLPYVPSRIAGLSSKVAPSIIGLGVGATARGILSTQQKEAEIIQSQIQQPTQTQPQIQPTPQPQTIEEKPQTIESIRKISYIPEPISSIRQKEDQKQLPRLSGIQLPKISDITKIQPETLTDTFQEGSQDTGQIQDVFQFQETKQIPETVQRLVPQQTTKQKQVYRTPPKMTLLPAGPTPKIVPPTFKLPSSKRRSKTSFSSGWRLKEHPVPTVKTLSIIGTKQRKRIKKSENKFKVKKIRF